MTLLSSFGCLLELTLNVKILEIWVHDEAFQDFEPVRGKPLELRSTKLTKLGQDERIAAGLQTWRLWWRSPATSPVLRAASLTILRSQN